MHETILTRNLSFQFAGKPVLNHIALQVQAGEIFGLLGPSGAGKTTLIKVLTGQLQPDDGYVELLGTDTKRLSEAKRRQIGMMMDNFGLYERLSIYDNLSFYADVCQVSRSTINGLLQEVGLYESRRIAVAKLSKGMKSRVSLARALLNNAKILFLDEPTAGLDPVTTKAIHEILWKQKKNGTTIFLTTHNMFEAESLCAHIALLCKGMIVESGTPKEICRKYNHLNKLQVALKDGSLLYLEHGSASADIVKEYLENESMATIHSTEPTLETVFMELTGKRLEEDA